jgi:hypothetical protein
MKLETPFIALILGGLMFTGVFTFMIGLANEHNVDYDLGNYRTAGNTTSLNDAFNNINETKTEMDKVTANFYNQTVIESEGGGLFAFFKATWQIGRLIGNNLVLYTQLTNAMAEIIGIPSAVVAALLSILFVVFAIAVLMILMGRIYN